MKRSLFIPLFTVFFIFLSLACSSALVESQPANVYVLGLGSPVPSVPNRKTGEPHWYYTIRFQETNGIGLGINTVKRYVNINGYPVFDAEYDSNIITEWFGSAHIQGYGILDLNSGRPVESGVAGEAYIIQCMDDMGNHAEFYGKIDFSTNPPSEPLPDPEHDTQNLRSNSAYEAPVAQGVWWVPASCLGKTKLGNEDIIQFLQHSPEEKQSLVTSLYEALQFFQIGEFRDAEDKVYIQENSILWEHHKPGYDAIRTNSGCCATNSNWLHYLLRNDYEESGFLSYSMADGNGHVLNYIKQNGFWYFIDLTHYRLDFLNKAGIETGNAVDYFASDYIAGNLHKAESPLSYIRYCLGSFNEPPGLFFLYTADDCLPVAAGEIEGRTIIYYPEGHDISVLYDNPEDNLGYQYASSPEKLPKWDLSPSVFE